MRARTVTLLSHFRPEQVAPAVRALVDAARAQGVTLRLDPDESPSTRSPRAKTWCSMRP